MNDFEKLNRLIRSKQQNERNLALRKTTPRSYEIRDKTLQTKINKLVLNGRINLNWK